MHRFLVLPLALLLFALTAPEAGAQTFTLSNNATLSLDNSAVLDLDPGTTLVETGGGRLTGGTGVATATRTLNAPTGVDGGGLGFTITSGENLGLVTLTRGHIPQTGAGNTGIARFYDVTAANNTDLGATLIFAYDEAELGGLDETTLELFRSEDGGTTWQGQGGTVDAGANTITVSGIDAFSRWTAGEENALVEPGTIIIEKLTEPTPNTTDIFGFTTTGGLSPSTFLLKDTETQMFSSLTPGTYVVTEDDPGPGFALTDLDCDDDASTTPSTVNLSTRTATIELDAGETVTCTFTNTVQTPADATEDLIDQVTALVDAGTLTEKDGKKLTKKLDKALKNLDKGKLDKAVNDLNMFIKDVNKLITKGKLPEAEGQALIDAAEAIIDQLEAEMMASVHAHGVEAAQELSIAVPEGFALDQNYPNPFNPSTLIAYSLAEAGPVTLKVYNVLGQEVATLVSGYKESGRHQVVFDASRLSAGIYLYVIKAGSFTATQRMTLLK